MKDQSVELQRGNLCRCRTNSFIESKNNVIVAMKLIFLTRYIYPFIGEIVFKYITLKKSYQKKYPQIHIYLNVIQRIFSIIYRIYESSMCLSEHDVKLNRKCGTRIFDIGNFSRKLIRKLCAHALGRKESIERSFLAIMFVLYIIVT